MLFFLSWFEVENFLAVVVVINWVFLLNVNWPTGLSYYLLILIIHDEACWYSNHSDILQNKFKCSTNSLFGDI